MGIRILEPEVITTCETSTGFNNISGTTISTGAIHLPTGATAPRVKVTGTASTNIFWSYNGSLNFAGKRGLEFWIYLDVPGPSVNSSGFSGYVRVRDVGQTNQFQANIVLKPGWNQVRLGRGNFTAVVGSPNWDTTVFTDVLWKLDAISGVTPTLHVSNLSYSGYARPHIAVIFDDGYNSVFDNALPIMNALSIPGTVAVIANAVGSSAAFMNLGRLAELHNIYGWSLVNHSKSHQLNVLPTASEDACFAEVSSGQQFLQGNGFTRDDEHLHYCSPYGEWSASYLRAASRAGTVVFRGVGVGDSAQPSSNSLGDSLPSASMGHAARLASFVTHCIGTTSTWTADQINAYINHGIYAGQAMILLFHSIESPADTSIKTDVETFRAVMQHIYRNRARLEAVTLPVLASRMAA